MPMIENEEIIILGGGLAGLSAAFHSGRPLYEANARPGGTADSICKNGYVFDLGIHVLHSKNAYFLDLLSRLELPLGFHKRDAWIYSGGQYFLYPFQVNTSHLPLRRRIDCVAKFLLRNNRKEAANYEEWMINNFGQGFSDTFLIPYAEKFWRYPPRDMTYEWAGDRVPRPKLLNVLKGMFRDQDTALGPNPLFSYPAKPGAGFADIALTLANASPHIHCGMQATRLDLQARRVIFNNGEKEIHYQRLISTIPLPELLRLCPDVPTTIQSEVVKLKCNSIATVNLGVDRPRLSGRHWIHFPAPEISFFRMSFPTNFAPGLAPDGVSTIQAEISYDQANAPDKEHLCHQVIEDLRRVGILATKDKVVYKDMVCLPYAYVIYTHDRHEAVQKIHDFLYTHQVYPCGRYGDWEYQWSDEAILSGKKTIETVLSQ